MAKGATTHLSTASTTLLLYHIVIIPYIISFLLVFIVYLKIFSHVKMALTPNRFLHCMMVPAGPQYPM